MKILLCEDFDYNFDVSLFAIKELAKRKGFEVFFYYNEYDELNNLSNYKLLKENDLKNYHLYEDEIIVTVNNLGENVYYDILKYEYDFGDLRTDKDLITIFEEDIEISNYTLGINEIPDGTYYYVVEDDAFEHIIVREDYNWEIAKDNS